MNDNFMSTRLAVLYCVGAFILQTLLSGIIKIWGIAPNFMLIATIIIAIRSEGTRATVVGFVLGLLYDLLGSSAIGPMALVCAVVGFVVSQLVQGMDLESFTFPLALIAVCSFAAEVVYCILDVAFGTGTVLLKSLGLRALPAGLYDALVGAIIFLLRNFRRGGARGGASSAGSMPSTPGNAASASDFMNARPQKGGLSIVKRSGGSGGMPALGGGSKKSSASSLGGAGVKSKGKKPSLKKSKFK